MNLVRLTRWAWLLGFESGVDLGREHGQTKTLEDLHAVAGPEERSVLRALVYRVAMRRLETLGGRPR